MLEADVFPDLLGTLTGERYRVMLEADVFPDLLNPG
jgi:hypothetical protein